MSEKFEGNEVYTFPDYRCRPGCIAAAELTIRLSFFWVSLTATTIVGALVAAGLLQMRGLAGLPGWS